MSAGQTAAESSAEQGADMPQRQTEGAAAEELMRRAAFPGTDDSEGSGYDAFDKEIFKDDYLYLYITELGMILNYLIARNDTIEAKRLCIEKFIKLYNECKIKSELKKVLPVSGDILDLIENNNVGELIEIFTKYKDAKQYFFAKLKSNIRQDLTKTEVM